jgi:hypothetical protein
MLDLYKTKVTSVLFQFQEWKLTSTFVTDSKAQRAEGSLGSTLVDLPCRLPNLIFTVYISSGVNEYFAFSIPTETSIPKLRWTHGR